jgi:hypothetical protein
MDTKDLIINHAVISILGWLVGISLGWVTSYVLIIVWRKSNLNTQKFYPLLFFIPWRTFICGLLLVNYFPIFLILQFGLGSILGIFSVAHVVFWLTLMIVFHSVQAKTVKPILHFLSWARTLAVFSVILTTHYGVWGGGGLGFIAKEHLFIMKYKIAWSYFWWMVGIAIGIDIVIAFGQMLVYHYTAQKEAG